MWETLAVQLAHAGYPVLMERPVVRIHHSGDKVTYLVTRGKDGEESFVGTDFISSMPIRELINALEPQPPQAILEAANRLRYRDFLIVSLIVNRKNVTPDNWIYVHELADGWPQRHAQVQQPGSFYDHGHMRGPQYSGC